MHRFHQSPHPLALTLFANSQSSWAIHLQSRQPSQFGAAAILKRKLFLLTASPPAGSSPGTTLSQQPQSWLQASTHPPSPTASSKVPLSSSQLRLHRFQQVQSHQPTPSALTVHHQRSQPQTPFPPSRVSPRLKSLQAGATISHLQYPPSRLFSSPLLILRQTRRQARHPQQRPSEL